MTFPRDIVRTCPACRFYGWHGHMRPVNGHHPACPIVRAKGRSPNLPVTTRDVNVGDLGCIGVNVDEWHEKNRVPLFPGKVNNWLLARTLRDKPTPDDLRYTLMAVMNKWFEGSPLDPGLEAIDPTGGRTGSGAVDGIILVKAYEKRPTLPGLKVARRREDLPMPPVPLLNSKAGVIFIHATFNFRGLNKDISWPVRTAPGMIGVQLQSSARCPVDADWMLVEAFEPVKEAPPEKSLAEAAADGFAKGLTQIVSKGVEGGLETAGIATKYVLMGVGIFGAAYILLKVK